MVFQWCFHIHGPEQYWGRGPFCMYVYICILRSMLSCHFTIHFCKSFLMYQCLTYLLKSSHIKWCCCFIYIVSDWFLKFLNKCASASMKQLLSRILSLDCWRPLYLCTCRTLAGPRTYVISSSQRLSMPDYKYLSSLLFAGAVLSPALHDNGLQEDQVPCFRHRSSC